MFDWQDRARALRIGDSRKIEHCGSGKSAYIGNTDHGIRFHCLRCHEKDFIPHDQRSIAEILATRRLAEAEAFKTATMPSDAVDMREADSAGMVWLLRAGISPETASVLHKIRWHPKTHRVLVPITEADGTSNGYVARSIDGTKPKYILKGEATIHHTPEVTSDVAVVVEDVLSSIAIHRAGYSSKAVLGTSITPEQARLLGRFPVLLGWFDYDKAGELGYQRLRRAMSLYDTQVKRVHWTGNDPKTLSKSVIRNAIQETMKNVS